MNSFPLDALNNLKEQGLESLLSGQIKIMVGSSTCGLAAGADAVYSTLKTGVKKRKMKAVVTRTGCIGLCHQEPLVDIIVPGSPRLTYARVTPQSAAKLLEALGRGTLPKGALGRIDNEPFLYDRAGRPYADKTKAQEAAEIPALLEQPFYSKQLRIALKNCGHIDPENLGEYLAKGGYGPLAAVLKASTPEQVIKEVEQSGLRGRGGAGFPTGQKWKICRRARSEEKYIICNADEGDPGAYMDRSILEGDPHSVIEGMVIAAYAIGASRGYIYVRDEYPLAVERLEKALAQAAKHGLLGSGILQSKFSFEIEVCRGAGAFVCGEETALIRSIEGECGEPRQRPPYPAECGLWGKPTVINNVETLATVPSILQMGAGWFRSVGTKDSKGTKVFSLVGKINRTGLVEVPMGTTLREIVFDIGGGVPRGRSFKAVQTGGPSGGCIPADMLDLPVDYEALARTGSIMGSGGIIVMDDRTCMVDVAKYFLNFLENESCGKCTPCRVGLKRMREILDDISEGRGRLEDLSLLEKMAVNIQSASLCGFGRTAPNPILSVLKYFRDECLAHILSQSCPAGVCTALIKYGIDKKACTGCGACKKACPAGAVMGEKKKPHKINLSKCIKCGACLEVCPADAVTT